MLKELKEDKMQKKLDPNKILDYYVDWCADQGKITVTQNINKSDELCRNKRRDECFFFEDFSFK